MLKSVELVGVPQIPNRAHRLLSLGYQELPPEIEAEANTSILAATQEIRARKLATKATFDELPDPDLSEFEE